jgi:asparagine synthase (glutamine-hydrolysing)
MAGALQHRGPDGVGLYLDHALGMVNTRLAIVDVAGGDQPLANEDERFWVMQNGEIYNAPELTEQLVALGHRFRTHCDTEVLVHAYEQWGTGALQRLNGPFAFAIWDRVREELFLARDRLGIRPLFIAETGGAFLFGSECKALLCDQRLPSELDPRGLLDTFSLWATGPERSAFRAIRELPPGHAVFVGQDRIPREWCWWELRFAPPSEQRAEEEDSLAGELLELLTDATRLRLRADVPVGAYLSGGLDSSAIAALVKRGTNQTLRSFGVQFTDLRFDERDHQLRMSEALGIGLQSLEVDGRTIAEAFPEVVRLAEKPMLRTAPVPLFLLSRLVRDSGFKVVLTGEGADEVFAGYNIFKENKVRRFWARQPQSKCRPLLLSRLYPYLATDLASTGPFGQAFFARGLTETQDPLYSHRIRFANAKRARLMMSPELIRNAGKDHDPEATLVAGLPAAYQSFTSLGRAQYLEMRTFLQGYLLHTQGDRMLMGNAVEGRFPFLDHRIVEFACALPDRLKLRGLQEKYLLRKAVSPLLPQEISTRPKRPYRAPIHQAFIGPKAPDWVGDVLSQASILKAGLFHPGRVKALVDKCRKGFGGAVSEMDEMSLVGILSTMLLHEQFVVNKQRTTPLQPTRAIHGDSRGLSTDKPA